jgi:calpain-15
LQKNNRLQEVDLDENWQGLPIDVQEARAKNLFHNVEETSTFAPISNSAWSKYIGADVDYTDMQQGQLGDCYFLAALVSIAKARPDIIRGMFTNEELLTDKHPTYTTKWNINGKLTKVAVNDMLPAPSNKLSFAKGRGHTYWPSLLEKAWAKIFGDYKTIESGNQEEVFKAITQAPVVHIDHEEVRSGTEQDGIDAWNLFAHGTNKKYIMGASTGHCSGRTKMGIVCGHAFAVLKVVAVDGYPQVMKMYNPWGSDEYNGVLANEWNSDKEDGIFYCTFDEFLENFGSSVIAEVQEDAVLSSIVLSARHNKP